MSCRPADIQTTSARSVGPGRLCAPTSKNRGPVLHKSVHLLCYDVKSPVKAGLVAVREQFGVMKASLALRDYLCEPALKKLVQG